MKKRLILVGKAASGKDHARKICEQWMGMPYQVSYTTRPPRNEEQEGKDYFFISEERFKEMITNDEWYEYVVFNNWYYGTTREQFDTKGSVFIMTPTGLSHLSEEDRKESFVIYFDIDEETRKHRMYQRAGNADSVERRLEADAKDFANFANYDIVINKPNYMIGNLVDIVREHMAVKLINFQEN